MDWISGWFYLNKANIHESEFPLRGWNTRERSGFGILWFMLIWVSMTTTGLQAQRIEIDLTENWLFAKGNPAEAETETYVDSAWQKVRLPHDWAIAGPFDPNRNGETAKLPWWGEGWYRRELTIPKSEGPKQVYLLFDGAMAKPDVYVNGKLAGSWDYGYNSFWLDITPLIKKERNVLAVHLDTRQHGSRWYPGAGLYRKVHLIVSDPVHVPIWGVWITTPAISETQATVSVQVDIANFNLKDQEAAVETTILSPSGRKIDTREQPIAIPANQKQTVTLEHKIDTPKLWDITAPNLYKAVTVVRYNGKIADVCETTFGIRQYRFTADDGFYLNGRRVQIKGVNLHHDQGPLGARFYERAMERQLEIMKEMGCNAIRTSHNMPAPELLDLCDRMGMLVLDEAFDKWNSTADWDNKQSLAEFGERQIRNFVLRDRNHPSVVLWSAGNEMSEIETGRDPQGREKLKTMVDLFRKYDPTRQVTIACHIPQNLTQRLFDLYDIHSWNYGRKYHAAHEADPNKPALYTESASALSTRGFYELPLPTRKDYYTKSLQVSSYDHNSARWSDIPDVEFDRMARDTYVCGEFVWTGFDYLGEPTPYNSSLIEAGTISSTRQCARSSYFGIVDLCGFPKDRYYLYRSYWAPDQATLHILPHWNWTGNEGLEVPVYVYTNADSAELFINGKSQGKRTKADRDQTDAVMDCYRLRWMNTIYEPGELKVVAYRDGQPVGESVRRTAGSPSVLQLVADRVILKTSGDDLSYVTVSAIDKDNNPCPLADPLVQFQLEGPGVIEAVGNGNPQSLESFVLPERRLFNGKALVIIRALGGKGGTIKLTASSEGFAKAEVTLESK